MCRALILTLPLVLSLGVASPALSDNAKRGPKAPRPDIAATCALIEKAARDEDIEPMILARLLWRLTGFRADLYPRPPRGREALLKMPRTGPGLSGLTPQDAAAIGLNDPYDAEQSARSAARSLTRKKRLYGNIGLAVAGYRLDHWRLRRFIAGDRSIPAPIAELVKEVTGTDIELWRDAPPISLISQDSADFSKRCAALAEPPPPAPPPPPWGAILATRPDARSARALADSFTRQLQSALKGHAIITHQMHLPGRTEADFTVQIGAQDRDEASALCARFRRLGLSCMVLKNQPAP